MSYNNAQSSGISKTVAVDIGYNEISAAATTFNYEGIAIPAYGVVKSVSYFLLEAFDGGATSALTVEVGDGVDPNGYILASEVHLDGTEVYAAIVDGAYITNTDSSGKLYGATADTVDVLFTATGANTSVLTQGKIRVVVSFEDIAQV
jgi:hypothetical protein